MTKTTGKKTLTFNPEKYQEVLVKYQPKLIKTEAENEKALEIIEELMHKSDRSVEENELYQLLIVLVAKFEQEYYLVGETASSESVLLLLMEQKGLKPEDLVELLGSQEVVSEILKGQKSISKTQAISLAKFFHVSPELFL